MRTINQAGIQFLKDREGLRLKPYLDTAGIPTIGIGTIKYPNGVRVTMNDAPITEEQAIEYLEFELKQKEAAVEKMVSIPINDNQFSALVSFAYNLGVEALHGSTLLKRLNSGDISGAADEFLKWNKNKVNGELVVNPGLVKRREMERSLFLKSAPTSNQLPDGPTDEDINEVLEGIEDDIVI
jgi:lysozyme